MTYYNASTTGFNAVASMPSYSVHLLTFAIMAGIAITFFLLIKDFRRFIYGLFVIVPLSILYLISSNISQSAAKGDITSLLWLLKGIALIFISLIIGFFFEKTKLAKKIEESLKNNEVNQK